MRHAFFALLTACSPSIPVDAAGDDTGLAGDAGDDGDDGGDDGGDAGDDGGDDGGDTGVEEIPDGDLVPVLDPPGGGFLGQVEVSVSAPVEGAQVLACVAPPHAPCALAPVDGPLLLDQSGVVHARVDLGAAEGAEVAAAFYEIGSDVSGFSSDLPLLVLWTESSGGALGENTPVSVTLLDGAGARVGLRATPADSGRGRIHIRGSSSANLDKKAFDLELWQPRSERDRPAALLGMPEDADWVLYAPYYWDDALIRNALGYQLSNDVGRYASRTRFVEVFLATSGHVVDASTYVGVYMLTEEIEAGADRVDVAALGPEDLAEPEITGGYVFKRDRSGSGDATLYGGTGGGAFTFNNAPIVPVDPQTADLVQAQLDWLDAELDHAGWALAAADGIDPTSGRHYGEILDVDSFIDHHILNVLFKNPDAFRLSGYFHKDREGLVVAGPIWDLDRTAGSVDSRAQNPRHWDATNQTPDTTNVFDYGWYRGLFADPAFQARYWARWEELLAGELSLDAIDAHIDQMEAELDEAGERNAARWGRPGFHEEVSGLRSWMATRHAWIGACIATYANPRDCPG